MSVRVQHGGRGGCDGKHVCAHEIHEKPRRRTKHEAGDERAGQDSHDQEEGKNSCPESH